MAPYPAMASGYARVELDRTTQTARYFAAPRRAGETGDGDGVHARSRLEGATVIQW
ncbi:hypothetical protein [Streptomyces venetus]|uniref:hypothetical protein n=1 Tax=Streptomyces venetus TaxID=1701086 RepID=UPI003CD07308